MYGSFGLQLSSNLYNVTLQPYVPPVNLSGVAMMDSFIIDSISIPQHEAILVMDSELVKKASLELISYL